MDATNADRMTSSEDDIVVTPPPSQLRHNTTITTPCQPLASVQ